LAALFGLTLSHASHAALAAPPPPSGTAANVLTLYAEPGLRGRHAVYKAASNDVDRQGFVARSAASTGLWTLCEGHQVASRCQTVQGAAPELKLAPEIVRPGLNALALYDQPGLKGGSIIYSFAADRPAPFHARSARTWGGPWSLCERDFKRCQTLDGARQDLDLVVAAVRPAPDVAASAAEGRIRAANRHALPLTPVSVRPRPPKRPPSAAVRLVHAAPGRERTVHPAIHVRAARPLPAQAEQMRLFTPVLQRTKAGRGEPVRRLPVRGRPSAHRPAHARPPDLSGGRRAWPPEPCRPAAQSPPAVGRGRGRPLPLRRRTAGAGSFDPLVITAGQAWPGGMVSISS
jgi:hypothetical protein